MSLVNCLEMNGIVNVERVSIFGLNFLFVYVGETSRPLKVRYQEHYRSAANPTAKSYQNMAFARHYQEYHKGEKPKLLIKILKKTKRTVERKITEALFIQRIKPDINGKYEQLNILDFVV